MEQGPASGCAEFARQVSTMVANRSSVIQRISPQAVLGVSVWVMRSGWVILHVTLLFQILSIATPYWIVSTTNDYHDGIWPKVVDPECAHVLYPDHLTGEPKDWENTAIAADFYSQCGSGRGSYYVRDPMDDWIKGVQAPMVLGTIFLLLAAVMMNYRAFVEESYFTPAVMFATMCSAFGSAAFTFIAVCVFGLRYSSLLSHHNYKLSWSYGFAVVPCFFGLLSSILLLTEVHLHLIVLPLNKKQNQNTMQQAVNQSQSSTEMSPMEGAGSANHAHGTWNASAQSQSTIPNTFCYNDRPDLQFRINPNMALKTDIFCTQQGEARGQGGTVSNPQTQGHMDRSEINYITDLATSYSAPAATQFPSRDRGVSTRPTSERHHELERFESAEAKLSFTRDNNTPSNQVQRESSARITDDNAQGSQSVGIFSRDDANDPFCVENKLKVPSHSRSASLLTRRHQRQQEQRIDHVYVQRRPKQKVQDVSKAVECGASELTTGKGIENTDRIGTEDVVSQSHLLEAPKDPYRPLSPETSTEVTRLHDKLSTKPHRVRKSKQTDKAYISELEMPITEDPAQGELHANPAVTPKRRSPKKRRKDIPHAEHGQQD